MVRESGVENLAQIHHIVIYTCVLYVTEICKWLERSVSATKIDSVDEILTHCWPVVNKRWLHFVAGLLWTIAGVLLLNFAFGWFKPLGMPQVMPFALAGLLLALAIYFLGFSKFAGKNVRRIEQIRGEKTGLFAFQAWTSYPLVVFMIALGITLRHYA